MDNNVTISKENINRIIKDIKDIRKNPLTEHGIYYKHDEENILEGNAMIIGPRDTPYQYGYYFFKIMFPANYPYSPPVVKFNKNNHNIRFHPNFYRNGKVCLSILNTWRGEQWTSCQTLSTILLTMCSVMTENPLLNEPGISLRHKDNIPYNKIITYQNVNCNIIDVLNKNNIEPGFLIFYQEMINNFKVNFKDIENVISNIIEPEANKIISTGIYSMSLNVQFDALQSKYKTMKNNILT